MHIDILRGKVLSKKTLFLKGETIRLLNESLHDLKWASCNESIAAVFMILIFEVF